jgi:hypothetical protein
VISQVVGRAPSRERAEIAVTTTGFQRRGAQVLESQTVRQSDSRTVRQSEGQVDRSIS